jgi:ABC-type nitrate/sulfonate/bicarbonate transport system permease component
LLGLVALVWKGVVLAFALPPFLLPPPEAAVAALLSNAGTIGWSVLFTLRNAAAGLSVAFVVAVGLAAAFNASRLARSLLPIVIALRTAPALAIAPILIMVFGRGIGTAIAVVVIVSFFPLMVNAMAGLRAANPNALDLMHVLGAGGWATFWKVRLPFSLPYIFAGLRSAVTSAILAAMLAEWLSGAPGLGKLLLDAAAFRKTGLLWAGVLVSVGIAMAAFGLTAAIERRFTDWRFTDWRA